MSRPHTGYEKVDAALIGPNDLSQSMGMLGQFYEPVFLDAIQKVVDSAKAHNVYSGIHSSKIEFVEYWAKKRHADSYVEQ